MRIPLLFLAALSFSALLALSFPSVALSQGEQIVGYIEEVRGGAYWKKGEKKEKLDRKSAVRRALRPGEIVGIDPGGYLRLNLCIIGNDPNCKPTEITSTGEFRIVAGPPAQTEHERKREKSAQQLGGSGGRPMGVLSPFFSPAPESAVRPSTLVLRWVPTRRLGSFSVNIKDPNQVRRIWGNVIARGASGYLDSQELKQILTKYRHDYQTGLLVLEVEDQNGIGSQSRFSLLTAQDEESLDQELAKWNDESDPLMRHLGRVQAFFARNMFTEVAEEFEAALSETPYSRDLLLRTIQAHRDTGNTAREENLIRRLRPR